MNKPIGAITKNPSLVCIKCAINNNRVVTELASSIGYPDGYTCDDCGDVYNKQGKLVKQINIKDL
jgi:uncharacterized Zn finger protein